MIVEVPSQLAVRRDAFTRFAWVVLAFNILVVLWGAFVRATGSGAGCGDHWPLCDGEVIPQSPTVHKLIEFTHRATSGIDGILVFVMLAWAFRKFSKGSPVRLGAVLAAVFVVSEGLIGAGLVLLKQVAKNASGYWSTAHQLNTLALVGAVALTVWWSTGRRRLTARSPHLTTVLVSLSAVALLAVSGVIAALGNTLFPAASLAAGVAQDLDSASHIFLRLRVFHPVIALCTAVWLLYVARQAGRRAWAMVGILGAQLVLGLVNLLLLAPVWAQILHLLLADLLWVSLVFLSAELLEAPAD